MSNPEALAYDYSSQETGETRREERTNPEGAKDPEQQKNPEENSKEKEFHSTDGREMIAVQERDNNRVQRGQAQENLDAEFSALYPSDESPETTAQRNTEVSSERTA